MSVILRILMSGSIGAVVCGGLCFIMFFLLVVFDNQKLIEAVGYGLVVGMIGAFIGIIIGLAVGLGNLGIIGGGVTGFFMTLIVVAIYVLNTAQSSAQYGYFLGESRIIFIVLTLPTILTGMLTALFKNLIYKHTRSNNQLSP